LIQPYIFHLICKSIKNCVHKNSKKGAAIDCAFCVCVRQGQHGEALCEAPKPSVTGNVNSACSSERVPSYQSGFDNNV